MRFAKTIWIVLFILITGAGWVSVDTFYFHPKPIKFITPKGWPKPAYDFSKNPLTEEGFTLGRKLFYDGRLSKDGNFACGTCHQQFGAFNTYDHNLSHGFNNAQIFSDSRHLQLVYFDRFISLEEAQEKIKGIRMHYKDAWIYSR